jgi:hypothetical protein
MSDGRESDGGAEREPMSDGRESDSGAAEGTVHGTVMEESRTVGRQRARSMGQWAGENL